MIRDSSSCFPDGHLPPDIIATEMRNGRQQRARARERETFVRSIETTRVENERVSLREYNSMLQTCSLRRDMLETIRILNETIQTTTVDTTTRDVLIGRKTSMLNQLCDGITEAATTGAN